MKNPLAIYKGLPKPIYILFVATVINGVGIFVYPFLALYLTQRLHYSAAQAGTFLTIASILYVPGSFIGSKLADTFGRKGVLLTAQILMDICYILAGFYEGTSAVPVLVLLALLFDGAVDPAREALKMDVTNQGNRQASFSFLYLGHNVGFAIGPVIAGYLFYSSPTWLFWGNGILGILSMVPVLLWIKESKPSKELIEESKQWKTTEKGEEGGLFRALVTRPKLIFFALAVTFFSYAYSQTLFGLPLFTNSLFGEDGAKLYGELMALNGIVVVLCNPIIVSSLRRFHPLANTVISGLLYTIAFSLFALATSRPSLVMLSILFTIGEIIAVTNQNFYVANNTPISHRSRFSAIMPIIMGTGHAIAPMVGGHIIQRFSIRMLWVSTGLSALVGTLGILGLYLYERKRGMTQKLSD